MIVLLFQHPKVRNIFNMDFPDSHHLAKSLTIVTGPDTVNLTYHNFFAAKEVAQVSFFILLFILKQLSHTLSHPC